MPARVTFIERRFSIDLDGFSPAERSAQLAAFAKQELASAVASGDAPDGNVRYVDGVKGAPEERVKPDGGVILYEFSFLPEIAAAGLDYLRGHSPVLTGAYRDSHFILVDGEKVADASAIPPDATAILITNDQPYARKIEVGAMKMSVPPLLYDHAQSALASLYRQVAKIGLTFVELEGGYILKGGRGGARKGRRAGDPLTYPALIITRL